MDKAKYEYELKKVEFYRTRFFGHYHAIEFSKKRQIVIKNQIDEILQLSTKFRPNDFQFLDEISEMVIR